MADVLLRQRQPHPQHPYQVAHRCDDVVWKQQPRPKPTTVPILTNPSGRRVKTPRAVSRLHPDDLPRNEKTISKYDMSSNNKPTGTQPPKGKVDKGRLANTMEEGLNVTGEAVHKRRGPR